MINRRRTAKTSKEVKHSEPMDDEGWFLLQRIKIENAKILRQRRFPMFQIYLVYTMILINLLTCIGKIQNKIIYYRN